MYNYFHCTCTPIEYAPALYASVDRFIVLGNEPLYEKLPPPKLGGNIIFFMLFLLNYSDSYC